MIGGYDMVKVGVVGLGVMGQHHARVYSQLGCQFVGVADADFEKARTVGEHYGIPYYADYRELLSRVDAVSIVVPTSLHRKVAVDFLSKGIHCLVEKPIASKLEDAEEMRIVAQATQAKLAVGHIERFNPAVTRLKEIINEGVLGEIMIISTRRVGPFARRIRDVGIIVDSASHDIDVARYLVGKEPVTTFARSGRLIHASQEDHAVIVLDFGSSTASIEVNWFTPHKVRTLVATGSKGIAYLDYIEQRLTVHRWGEEWDVPIEKTEPLKLELEHFLRCAENNEQPLVDGLEGIRVLELCLAAARQPKLQPLRAGDSAVAQAIARQEEAHVSR
jgi:UDP-N-acetylglucosamine 3-dehydrogenase